MEGTAVKVEIKEEIADIEGGGPTVKEEIKEETMDKVEESTFVKVEIKEDNSDTEDPLFDINQGKLLSFTFFILS